MKLNVIILIILLPFFTAAQVDTTYWFGVNGKPEPGENWKIKKEIDYRSFQRVKIRTTGSNDTKDMLLYTEKVRMKADTIQKIKISGKIFKSGVVRTFKKLDNGKYRFIDYEKKRLKRVGITKKKIPLLLDGEVREYFKNGALKSISVYENNQLVSNQNWQGNGDPYINNIFYSVDKDPMFPRGMGYVHNHILKVFKEYGLDASSVAGSLKVGFVVLENGRIDGVRIEQGISSSVNSLAVRAFKTLIGEWEPAVLNDKTVRYYQIFPINFVSNQYSFDYLEVRGSTMYWQH